MELYNGAKKYVLRAILGRFASSLTKCFVVGVVLCLGRIQISFISFANLAFSDQHHLIIRCMYPALK